MTKSLEDFFSAWAIADADARGAQVSGTLGDSITYIDPRTEAPLTNPDAVIAYVGGFSQMAPGMAVSVVHESNSLNHARVAVQFGEGERSQMGQYVADLDDNGKITRLVGFAGMGTPE